MELDSHADEGRRLMTRRRKPTEGERQTLLRSLIEVGSSKPIGYLPLHTIKDFVQLSQAYAEGRAIVASARRCELV